jgi:hypothetical protein
MWVLFLTDEFGANITIMSYLPQIIVIVYRSYSWNFNVAACPGSRLARPGAHQIGFSVFPFLPDDGSRI